MDARLDVDMGEARSLSTPQAVSLLSSAALLYDMA